jgi:hypothetical protein
MRLRRRFFSLFALVIGLGALAGCGETERQAADDGSCRPVLGSGIVCPPPAAQEPQEATQEEPDFDPAFRCQATPDRSVVYPGELVEVSVALTGLPGPFLVQGFPHLLFGERFTLRGSYNDPGVDRAMTRVFYAYDARDTSRRAKCSFPITVKTSNASGSSALACSMTATPSLVSPNVPVELKLTLRGVTRPVSLDVWPAPHWRLPGRDLRFVSSTEVRANVRYPTAGQRSPHAIVHDGVTSAVCNTSVSVYSPILTLQAAPATTVFTTQRLTVVATTAGFPSAPTLSFTTNEPGIGITVSANAATIQSTDGLAHNFRLTVRAVQGPIERTETIDLSFVPAPSGSLACQLQGPVRPFLSEDATFQLSLAPGSSTSDTLARFEQALPADATVVSTTASSVRVRFSTPGIKTVRLRARGATSHVLCNTDGWVQTSVVAVGRLASRACTIAITPGSSKLMDPLVALATIDDGVGRGPFRLESLEVESAVPALGDLGVEVVPGAPRPGDQLLALAVRFFRQTGGNVSGNTWATYRARVVDVGDTSAQAATSCASTHALRPL